ncbi:MAG: hypothetical protein KKF30_18815 [Proteobacteria bacterium]|nr:hypothetical protein [Pseudomonadota bacterium]MBU4470866.1 hypothetical protein [Pseudomonadota bacterium]MCG2751864.1 hypothetical protein [Desulfobacteraceae bacterium]
MAIMGLTPEQAFFERSVLRSKFFIFVHIGALMIMLPTITPFFGVHLFPALIILILSVVYDTWITASKKAKRLMVYPTLLLGLWVGMNTINHWIMPTPPLTDMVRMFGFLGHVLVMVGAFQAIKEIRLMD